MHVADDLQRKAQRRRDAVLLSSWAALDPPGISTHAEGFARWRRNCSVRRGLSPPRPRPADAAVGGGAALLRRTAAGPIFISHRGAARHRTPGVLSDDGGRLFSGRAAGVFFLLVGLDPPETSVRYRSGKRACAVRRRRRVPAAIYLALNRGPTAAGWSVPTAGIARAGRAGAAGPAVGRACSWRRWPWSTYPVSAGDLHAGWALAGARRARGAVRSTVSGSCDWRIWRQRCSCGAARQVHGALAESSAATCRARRGGGAIAGAATALAAPGRESEGRR